MNEIEQIAKAMCEDGCGDWDRTPGHTKEYWLRKANIAWTTIDEKIKAGNKEI